MTWDIENELIRQGYKTICGVDEAGRGPLAGPVAAAAVILPHGMHIAGLADSKKLTAHKRETLYDEIISKAVAYAVAVAGAGEIDSMNILNATYLAMNRAIERLGTVPDIALIDGNQNKGIGHPSRCIVKGDGKSPSIAAASILAKVTRDRYMIVMARKYPAYGFDRHKGYGTKLHYEMLGKYGPSEIHRKSFLKKWQGGRF